MKSPRVIAVIPARHASSRFPGKPLAPILGKPLLQWVWEGAKEASLLQKVVIATDNEQIAQTARSFGAEVTMTAAPEGFDPEAPRHCREDMLLVVEAQ